MIYDRLRGFLRNIGLAGVDHVLRLVYIDFGEIYFINIFLKIFNLGKLALDEGLLVLETLHKQFFFLIVFKE